MDIVNGDYNEQRRAMGSERHTPARINKLRCCIILRTDQHRHYVRYIVLEHLIPRAAHEALTVSSRTRCALHSPDPSVQSVQRPDRRSSLRSYRSSGLYYPRRRWPRYEVQLAICHARTGSTSVSEQTHQLEHLCRTTAREIESEANKGRPSNAFVVLIFLG